MTEKGATETTILSLDTKVREKVAALSVDALVTESQLGKPSGKKLTSEMTAEFANTIQKLLDEKLLFRHGAKLGKRAPESPTAMLEKAVRAKFDAVSGDALVTENQLGKPTGKKLTAELSTAFTSILQKLLDEKLLFRHGTKLGKRAPLPTPWHQVEPYKKPFEAIVKAVKKLLELEKVDPIKVMIAFQEILGITTSNATIVDAKYQASLVSNVDDDKVKTSQFTTPSALPYANQTVSLEAVIHEAYEHLCKFTDFRDRVVEIRRVFYEAQKKSPQMTVEEFHKEILELEQKWIVELYELNEVREARDPHLAIKRNDRIFYFIRWK